MSAKRCRGDIEVSSFSQHLYKGGIIYVRYVMAKNKGDDTKNVTD